MKLNLPAVAAVAIMMSQTVFAAQAPESCPSVEQLQANGVTLAISQSSQQNAWAVINPSNSFGTNYNWTLVAGPIVGAQTEADAIRIANEGLSNLVYAVGPELAEENGDKYGCIYYGKNPMQDFAAFAVTPPDDIYTSIKYLSRVKK